MNEAMKTEMIKSSSLWDKFYQDYVKHLDTQHPVLNQFLRYGAMGFGLGSAAGLYREISDALDEREKKKDRDDPKISPDTIVIRIPRRSKTAEVPDDGLSKKLKTVDLGSDYTISVSKEENGKDGKTRDVQGRFAPSISKCASTPEPGRENMTWWQSLTTPHDRPLIPGVATRGDMIVASLFGGIGGFYLADLVTNKIQENRLKKQIEAAQQQYFDLIDGVPVKKADAVNRLFNLKEGAEKRAATPLSLLVTGYRKLPPLAVAGWNLTALTSAYLTKKYLEDRFGKREDFDEKPRKVTRVVFRTDKGDDEAGEGEKSASSKRDGIEISPEVALCAIEMMKEAMEEEYYSPRTNLTKGAQAAFPGVEDPFGGGASGDPTANPQTYNPVPTSPSPSYIPPTLPPAQPTNPKEWVVPLYRGLDWALNQDGGHQWFIDRYARENGFSGHENTFLPGGRSLVGAYGDLDTSTMLALRKLRNGDPEYVAEAKRYMMGKFKDDPTPFLTALGDKKNSAFVNSMAEKGLNSAFGKGGALERWGRIPILGNLFKTIAGYFVRNTGWGKRMALGRGLQSGLGWDANKVNGLLDKYDFNGGGTGWNLKKAAEFMKMASILGNVISFGSREKILTDVSNEKLLKEIRDLKNSGGKGKKTPKTTVYSDSEAKSVANANKDKIKAILSALDDQSTGDR